MNAWTLYKAHSRHPFHLDDEPKFMDPAKLNIYWNGTDRAARSILGYNEILWQPAGSSVARTDAEITDLGLNRSRPSSAPPDGMRPNSLCPLQFGLDAITRSLKEKFVDTIG